MKVNVLQPDQATFRRWHLWSNWIDIAIFDFASGSWLVQMSMTRSNRKRFRCVSTTGVSFADTRTGIIGDLMPMCKALEGEG